MSLTETKLITADELLAMGEIGRCALLYGELVIMSPAGYDHGVIAGRIARFIGIFADEHDLGDVPAAETGYFIERNPDVVIAADTSFVRKERVKIPRTPKFFDGVPDLAVEVISPGDIRREVSEKVNMWLAHGSKSVWVADPLKMTIAIHRIGIEPVIISREQELRDDAVLPGFVMSLKKVFKQP